MLVFDDSYKKVCPSHEEITDYDKTFEDAANFAYNLINVASKPLSDNIAMTCKCMYVIYESCIYTSSVNV